MCYSWKRFLWNSEKLLYLLSYLDKVVFITGDNAIIVFMLPAQPNQSIIDGMRCLRTLSTAQHSLGAKELAQRLHVEPTRIHRLLRTLAYLGLASQDRERKYRAGPGMVVLGARSVVGSVLIRNAMGHIADALPEFRYTIEIGVMWEGLVLYLARGEPERWEAGMRAKREIREATETPLGMVLLAELPQERVELIYQGGSIPGMTAGIRGLLHSLREVRGLGYVCAPSRRRPGYDAVAVSLSDGATGLEISGKATETDRGEMILAARALVERIEWPGRK